MKAERRRRFVTEQQTRLDTLDSYCSTKKQWPGLNSNVIYVLQVLSAKFKFTTYQYIMIIIFLRNNSQCGALFTRQRQQIGCTTCSSQRAGKSHLFEQDSSQCRKVGLDDKASLKIRRISFDLGLLSPSDSGMLRKQRQPRRDIPIRFISYLRQHRLKRYNHRRQSGIGSLLFYWF